MFMDEGGGGSQGPWIGWTGEGAKDRSVPPDSFYIRGEEGQTGRRKIDDFDTGVVLDIHSLKVGYNFTTGVPGQAPEWVWGENRKMPPQPANVSIGGQTVRWKRGFSIMCGRQGKRLANWEQAGAGAFNGLAKLLNNLNPADLASGKLPVVKYTKSEVQKFKQGAAILPVLEIVKWIDRPDFMGAGDVMPTDDTGQAAPQTQPAPRQAAQPAPQPAAVAAATAAQAPVSADDLTF